MDRGGQRGEKRQETGRPGGWGVWGIQITDNPKDNPKIVWVTSLTQVWPRHLCYLRLACSCSQPSSSQHNCHYHHPGVLLQEGTSLTQGHPACQCHPKSCLQSSTKRQCLPHHKLTNSTQKKARGRGGWHREGKRRGGQTEGEGCRGGKTDYPTDSLTILRGDITY